MVARVLREQTWASALQMSAYGGQSGHCRCIAKRIIALARHPSI